MELDRAGKGTLAESVGEPEAPHAKVGKHSLTEIAHPGGGEWRWRDSLPSDDVVQRDAARASGGEPAHHDGSSRGGYDMHAIADEAQRLSVNERHGKHEVEPSAHGVPAFEEATAGAVLTTGSPKNLDGGPQQAADPYVLPLGPVWYLYTTGLGIAKSTDQGKTWATVGPMFTPPAGTYNAWAPEVHRVDGQFVAYVGLGPQDAPLQIYVATSSQPDSGWVLRPKPIVHSNVHADNLRPSVPVSMIDPTFYKDHDQNWLIWKEDWQPKTGVRRRIVMARCNKTGTRLIGKPHVVLTAGVGPYSAREARPGTHDYSIEAPTLVFHDGKYWLFYSGAGFEKDQANGRPGGYFVGVAWADHITGPYHREARPVITGTNSAQEPGHTSVIRVTIDGKPEWLIFFHAYDATPGDNTRYLLEDPLHWGKHGPYVRGGHPSSAAGATLSTETALSSL